MSAPDPAPEPAADQASAQTSDRVTTPSVASAQTTGRSADQEPATGDADHTPDRTRDPSQDPASDTGTASAVPVLEAALGVRVDPSLLQLSLTHRSYAYEKGGLPTNERLEFLGDSVLGLVVTETLYRAHPDVAEGQLAKLRASVVNMRALAGVARGLGPGGLGAHLRLGRGEEVTGGRDKDSILADALEAVLGAIYLDRGLEVAGQVVHRLFDPLMDAAAHRGAGLDWKTSLQELTALHGLGVPEYSVDETGPDHAKSFTASVLLGGVRYGSGYGRTKKEAEQRAAEATFTSLSAQPAQRVGS